MLSLPPEAGQVVTKHLLRRSRPINKKLLLVKNQSQQQDISDGLSCSEGMALPQTKANIL